MIVLPSAFVVVARDNKQVIGFIGGCIDTKKFYRDFFKKYFFIAGFILLSKIFQKAFLKKIFEIIKHIKQKQKELPRAELLSIAVAKKFQGQGIGSKMFEKFILEMRKQNIKKFKVIVGEELLPAIKFYEKMNFKFHSECTIHKHKTSKIYIYTT